MLRRLPILVAVVAASALAGCTATASASVASTSSTPVAAATPTSMATAATTVLEPLTGIAVPVGTASLANPSIASKIDNHPAARPQIGLEHTDLLYEELVEGGITRYVAVWQSDIPKEYGPVRSIRGMDPAIISPLKGIVTYSGGQPIFVAGMHATPVVNVVHGAAGTENVFYRTTAKAAPHNVITVTKNLLSAFGSHLAAPAQQYQYGASATESSAATAGTATSKITATFSTASVRTWKWDGASKKWLRAQNGVKDVDEHGKQLSATNVVVLRVHTTVVSHTPKTQLKGSGAATVSSGGKTVHGTWSKKSATSKIVLTTSDGTAMTLAPGNTWIELVPVYGSVSYK